MYTTQPLLGRKNRFSLADELDLAFSSISHLFADVSPKTGQPEPTKDCSSYTRKTKNMIHEAGITENSLKVIVAKKVTMVLMLIFQLTQMIL